MDLNFKQGASGIDAIRRIHAIHPAIGILVVTMFEDDHVFVAIRAGARGYLLKDAEPEEAVRAIRAISNGEAIFSPGIAERVMHYFAIQTEETADHPFPELTPREQDILTLLAKGYTNRAIAEQLCLSEKTIRNQVSAIYGKLQVADRASAIILARQKGLQ
jgi:DNA-binding NarL/FixJ family response regulator